MVERFPTGSEARGLSGTGVVRIALADHGTSDCACAASLCPGSIPRSGDFEPRPGGRQRGGLTPLLAVTDRAGREEQLILTEADRGPMARQRLAQVGRRITMTGRMIREGDLLFFRVAAA